MAILSQQRLDRPEVSNPRAAQRRTIQPAVCVDCVVCGSGQSRVICTADDMALQRRLLASFYRPRWKTHNAETAADRVAFTQDYTTDIVQCDHCGLLYRNPRPRAEDITRAYRHDRYDDAYLEAEFTNQRLWARGKLADLARRLRVTPGERPCVLEVGSFVGGLLAEGQARGWEMFGVDPGDEVTAFCRSKSLPVFHGTLEQADLQDERFDAIVVWNTFDQLPDPHPMLEAAVKLLKNGGVLTIRIPNGGCFSWAMDALAKLPAPLRRPLYTALAWNNLLTFPYVYGYSTNTVSALVQGYGFRRMGIEPDTLLPAPPGHLRWWARVESQVYQWVCRAAWHAEASERLVTAPWLDFYFERAATDGQLERATAAESGLGLVPVYAPLALRQTGTNGGA